MTHVLSVMYIGTYVIDILLLHNFLCVLLHFPPTQPLPSVTLTAVTLNIEAALLLSLSEMYI